jgi:hypothetical protein
MFIKLLRPTACFYPPRTEPAGSIVSIGGPRGAALIAAGIAEPAAQPPDIDDGGQVDASPLPEMPQLNAEADALIAALSSRRARRHRKNA